MVRAPLASPALAAAVGSAWFWAPLSHQQSSVFALDLGDLKDRATNAALEIRIQLLGWSNSDVPAAIPHHLVEMRLNGRSIGEGRWDGRRRHEIRLEVLLTEVRAAGEQRLELRIPARTLPGGDPLIDLIYVDPRFGERMVRRLLAGETVGEALAATKRELKHPGISHLYNLLGDPALTLDPRRADPGS